MSTILKKDIAKDYGLALSWRYAEIEFLGLPRLSDERIYRLEQIYVPLRLCRDWSTRFNEEQTSYVPKALAQHHHLIVLGDPGSGKSTLIKVLAYAFGEANPNAYKRACGDLIPIPIVLRNYATRSWHTFYDVLRDFISTLDDGIRNHVTSEWLLEYLRDGRAILLIDGLDEIGTVEERIRLRDAIFYPLLSEASKSFSVITSRVAGFDDAPLHAMHSVDIDRDNEFPESGGTHSDPKPLLLEQWFIAPFNEAEISQYITRWYQLRESSSERQRDGVRSLLNAFDQNDQLKQLAHSPQILTLILLIHRVTATLPSGRAELYDRIVEAYLESIQTYRKLGTPARLDEMKRWLAKVGWEMQIRRDTATSDFGPGAQGGGLLVSHHLIRTWLIEAITLEGGGRDALETADMFLNFVKMRSGLLVEQASGQFAFAHLSFQEYFAALELRAQVWRFDRLVATCLKLVSDGIWHETLVLLFEMLREFRDASDDLFSEIAHAADSTLRKTTGPANLFSALLLDQQSGIGERNRRKAAAFVLEYSSFHYDDSLINDLQSLSSEQKDALVRPWFFDTLRNGHDGWGKYFFIIGGELIEDWPEYLNRAIKTHLYTLSQPHVAEVALICARNSETYRDICPWVVDHLPLRHWIKPICHSFGTGGGLSLAEIYRNGLYSSLIGARSQFVIEMGIALSITKSQLFRLLLPLSTRTLRRDEELYDVYQKQDYMAGHSWERDPHVIFLKAVHRALVRVPARDLVRDIARDLTIDGSGQAEHAMLLALEREMVESTRSDSLPVFSNQRLRIFAETERALFRPEASYENLIVELQALKDSLDDWSQLLSISALLMIGAGSPELCRTRNKLIEKGFRRSNRFTFPLELQDETRASGFCDELPRILELIFLQLSDRPWLKPIHFTLSQPGAQYFLSGPDKFLDQTIDVFDPFKQTELAQWRAGII
jgi:energy-coupling factor transporter ATP-binding protein EcfA2